ncbi:MAG: phospholipid/cholesterol/gamma-HCH transport system substrate-binding protein [Saprospiraceae bacterium]
MEISRTLRVGALAIISIGILIWGYTYLKGKNIFANSTQIYAEYVNVDGLSPSAPVKVNGFKIGIVSSVYLKEDYSGKIVVVLDITESLNISKKGAVARIESSSIMGGKQVILDFPKGICDGSNCLESGDTIRGETLSLLGSMTSDLDPYLDKAERSFEAIDSMLTSWGTDAGSEDGVGKALNDIQAILSNLNSTSRSLKTLIGGASSRIDGVLANLEMVSSNLSESNAEIKSTLQNTSRLTQNLSEIDINGTLTGADKAIVDLQQTLASVDVAVKELNGVLVSANSGDGTLGLLLQDGNLYKDLDATMKNLDLLLEDVRKNPARYTRVLSKKRKPYEEKK